LSDNREGPAGDVRSVVRQFLTGFLPLTSLVDPADVEQSAERRPPCPRWRLGCLAERRCARG
jgi:hypothetical protein